MGGFLSRYQMPQMTPFAPELGPRDPRTGLPIDPRTGQPIVAAPAQPQAPQQSPFDFGNATGQWNLDAFKALNPNAPKPAARPPQPKQDFGPQMMPPNIPRPGDVSGKAYGQNIPVNGMMPANPDPDMGAYDPALAAYGDRQPQPGDTATGTGPKKEGDWFSQLGEGLGGFNNNDLLQMGLSMLGNSQNGGDWGAVGKDLAQVTQGVQQRAQVEKQNKRLDTQDAQNAKLFGYQEDELKATAAERKRVEEVRTGTKAAAQSMLDEMPADADPGARSLLKYAVTNPDAFQGVLEYQIGLAKEDRDFNREKKLAELQGNIQLRVAAMQAERDDKRADRQFDKSLAAADAQRIADSGGIIDQKRAALKNVDQTLGIIDEAVARGQKSGGYITPDGKLNQLLGQYASADSVDRIKSLTANRVLATLAVQKGAASEKDAETAGYAAVNPETMQFGSAQKLLYGMRDDLMRDLAKEEGRRTWIRDYGSPSVAFRKMPDGSQLSFDQSFDQDYKPGASPYAAIDSFMTTPNIPANAVTLLKQNPTDDVKRQFDAKYGAGSAARILTQGSRAGYSFGDASANPIGGGFGGY